MNGRVSPLIVNSGLPVASDDTVTLAPFAVRVPVRLLLLPTLTFPKLRVVGETANVPTAVAVPLSGTLTFAAFDITVTLPLAAPLAVGANVTGKVMLCPAVSVKGSVRPVRLNPAPLTVAAEIVALAFPVFLTTSNCVFVLPTWRLPKLRLVGFGVSTTELAGAPLPETGTARVLLRALLVKSNRSDVVPEVLGLNTTVIDVLRPPRRVRGRESPLTENAELAIVNLEMLRDALPVFFSESDRLRVLPRFVLAKVKLVGLALRVPLQF